MRTLAILLALTATAAADAPPKPAAAKPARIAVAVTKRGFDPDRIQVPAKSPVTLVFTRTTEQSCMKSVVVTLDDGTLIERALPLDQAVEIAVTFPKAGKLTYACSMDMAKGTIIVQ